MCGGGGAGAGSHLQYPPLKAPLEILKDSGNACDYILVIINALFTSNDPCLSECEKIMCN